MSQDGSLLGRLNHIFTDTVQRLYASRLGGRTGSVTVVQRTSSDLRLNPHLHLVALDGTAVRTTPL